MNPLVLEYSNHFISVVCKTIHLSETLSASLCAYIDWVFIYEHTNSQCDGARCCDPFLEDSGSSNESDVRRDSWSDMALQVFLNDGWCNNQTVDRKMGLAGQGNGGVHLGMIGNCKEFIRAGV